MNIDNVVAKMQCHLNQKQEHSTEGHHTIRLGCVYAGYEKDKENGENTIFGKYTPFGELQMSIANPAAAEFFKEGKKYYVILERAPD